MAKNTAGEVSRGQVRKGLVSKAKAYYTINAMKTLCEVFNRSSEIKLARKITTVMLWRMDITTQGIKEMATAVRGQRSTRQEKREVSLRAVQA